MIRAWRIVSAAWAESAFDGEGARLYGGRWNSPGRPIVYLAGSRALAALEMLVHLSPAIAAQQRFTRFEVHFDKALVASIRHASTGFKPFIEKASQAAGDAWLEAGHSPVLRVPSAVIPEETNYIVNPRHPKFGQIKIGPPEPFAFDSRLIQT